MEFLTIPETILKHASYISKLFSRGLHKYHGSWDVEATLFGPSRRVLGVQVDLPPAQKEFLMPFASVEVHNVHRF